MSGIDHWIAQFGGGTWTVLLVAVLLGLRHATDPDHLTAVSTLILSDAQHGARRANLLGLAWGLGHATTLFVFGLPIVLFRQYLPTWIQQVAEALVGVVIVILAVRLLLRWSRGYFHVHPHTHGPVHHAHPHVHDKEPVAAHPMVHAHSHAGDVGRSPLAAFLIGLVHGVGGSAGVGVLLIAAVPGRGRATLALFLFAAATAVSMGVVSSAFGYALVRGPIIHRLRSLVPLLGVMSLLFGIWYSVQAINP
ncbi:MAG: hypothetical protein ABI679_02535 [Gemmatimonadota bacterium]